MNPSTSVSPGRSQVSCQLIVLLLFTGLLTGESLRVGHADDAEPLSVAVTTINGDPITGRLQRLDTTLELLLQGDVPQQLDRESLICISRTSSGNSPQTAGALALLINGDVYCGEVVTIDADSLQLSWTGISPPTTLQIPLEFVRSMVLSQPEDETQRHRLQRMWALNQAETDRLVLQNGTYADGEFQSTSAEQVRMDTNFGPVTTPREEVVAIALNTSLAAEDPTPDTYAVLLGSDGSRVTLYNEQIASPHLLTGRTIWGKKIEFPTDRLQRLQLFSERVQSLSSRPPQKYVFTPYFTESHPLVTDRNVHGGPLALRGITYATGLGMHSRSEVTWNLEDAGASRFLATVGVDDMAGGQGHVQFTVDVDGQRVFESDGRTGRDPALPVGPIDISSAATLTLSVEFGRVGNIRDIANWCDPLLIQ